MFILIDCRMNKFRQVFSNKNVSVIGMIHVGALPGMVYIDVLIRLINKTLFFFLLLSGTPCYQGSVTKLIDQACLEAQIYQSCQVVSSLNIVTSLCFTESDLIKIIFFNSVLIIIFIEINHESLFSYHAYDFRMVF
jgi:hypothetical protein